MKYNYSAIVLDKRDIAEVDRLYTFYTLEEGKIMAVGKGTRKVSAKLAPHLENFTFLNLSVARRRGHGNIAGAIAEDYFVGIKNDADALPIVYRTMRLCNKLLHAQQRDQKLFALFVHYLTTLDTYDVYDTNRKNTIQLLSSAFLVQLFVILGYTISTQTCATCHKKLTAEKNVFDTAHVGMLCQSCSRGVPHTLPLSVDTIKVLRLIESHTIESLTKLRISDRSARQLEHFTKYFAQWINR